MTEQLAFDQIARYSRDVDNHKRFVLALGIIVNCLGYQLLTGTGFARNGYRDIGGAGFFKQREHTLYGRAGADYALFELVFSGDLFLEEIDLRN